MATPYGSIIKSKFTPMDKLTMDFNGTIFTLDTLYMDKSTYRIYPKYSNRSRLNGYPIIVGINVDVTAALFENQLETYQNEELFSKIYNAQLTNFQLDLHALASQSSGAQIDIKFDPNAIVHDVHAEWIVEPGNMKSIAIFQLKGAFSLDVLTSASQKLFTQSGY